MKKSTIFCVALSLVVMTMLIECAYGDVKILSVVKGGEKPNVVAKCTIKNTGTEPRHGTATSYFLGSGSSVGSINRFPQESYPFDLKAGETTDFTFRINGPPPEIWELETKDDKGQISMWYSLDAGETWTNKTKKQKMTFVSPFDLSSLTIPGTVTFELAQTDMISHSLSFMLPDSFGGGTVSLDFTHGYGEIFFNYTTRPDIVLFNITEWIMTYTEFYIPGLGWTGPNTAITSPESYGFLNVTSGKMSMYEPGVYLNNFFSQQNPIKYFILYNGTVDFISNTIHLDGEGAVYFPPQAPVGGIIVSVDKFVLLTPYIGLTSTTIIATVATAVYVKRVKHRKEKQ